jgi:DNA-binding IscR family transcriptional regulator
LVTSQRGREGGYRLALPAAEISIARVMRVEQGFLADVHGERPEDLDYPGPAAALGTVWVAARASYRRVLEQVTLADVVSGNLPAHVGELVQLEDAWRSFGDDAAR